MSIREYLSENLLDNNFVKLISPVYTAQLILGTSCLVMSGNLVSTITLYQKIYSIIWIITVSGSFYYFVLSYYISYYDKEKTLFYTFAFGLLVQYVSYLLNIFHARFLKSKESVGVFLKIQKVDRFLENKNLNVVDPGYYLNRVWLGYIITNFGSGFSIFVYSQIDKPLYTVPMGCAILSLYLEIVLTGSCIYYLAQRLQHLNTIIEKNIVNKKQNIDIRKIDVPGFTNVGEAHKIIGLKDLTKILTSILKLFHESSNLFTFEIFNLVVTMLIWTFLVIESTVVGLRSKLVSLLASVILMLWIAFYFTQLMSVAISCDWFAKQVRDTKRLAVHALSVCHEDKDADIRKAAWELLQLIEFEKPVFSVYGIFTLNTRLPIQLISVITTNVLVLIQYTSNALNTN
ncbi:uncharacterized protein LOC134666914 [Cydia fagiglandana]|uniref:uncharacterized protein LOC134666914 n=1 Tax=Cydia fagiglandana TaxID=1458189 RepID=UPI002FEDEE55